jgi:hypothetical protein
VKCQTPRSTALIFVTVSHGSLNFFHSNRAMKFKKKQS